MKPVNMRLTKDAKQVMLKAITRDFKFYDPRPDLKKLVVNVAVSYLNKEELALYNNPKISIHLHEETFGFPEISIGSPYSVMALAFNPKFIINIGRPLRQIPNNFYRESLNTKERKEYDFIVDKANKTAKQLWATYNDLELIIASCGTLNDLHNRLPKLKKYFPVTLNNNLKALGIPPKSKLKTAEA